MRFMILMQRFFSLTVRGSFVDYTICIKLMAKNNNVSDLKQNKVHR